MTRIRKIAAILLCLAAAGLIVNLSLSGVKITSPADPDLMSKTLGPLSLLPPVFAVALAFLTTDVVVSLLLGLVAGVAMLIALGGGISGPFQFLTKTFVDSVTLLVDTSSNWDYTAVLILCLVIGGLIGVIRASKGFEALAKWISPRINTTRKANYLNQFMGILIFFDDYANALITGPVMQPITDRMKISREKLAFIVDSTAAPVVSIALVSSWVAVEVSVINQGLATAGVEASGYSLFLKAIPYCFYCLFALIFVFLASSLQRDFGPMLKAETRARAGQVVNPGKNSVEDEVIESGSQEAGDIGTDRKSSAAKSILVVIFPILVFVLTALVSFYLNGRSNAIESGLLPADTPFNGQSIVIAFENTDTIFLVLVASALASVAALVLGRAFGLFHLSEGIETWIDGASSMLITVIVLVLAWSLANVIERLGTISYIVQLVSLNVSWWLVPSLLFIACMLTSYAAGSFGAMFIAMPMAVPIAQNIILNNQALVPASYMPICIAAVIAGGVFGDHASPLTDVTILSAFSAGCGIMDHVRTQLPYAMVVAAVAIVFGLIPTTLWNLPVWLCLIIGSAVMAAVIYIFGKNPGQELAKLQAASAPKDER